MSLLWTFMGYSRTYTIFTGVLEVLGGILLFVPRVAGTIGAIVSFAALTQVFLLNMCYGVNLKLYSLHLLLMSLFLLAPEFRWLGEAFVMRKPVQPREPCIVFPDKRLTSAVVVLQMALGAAVFTSLWISEWRSDHQWDLPRSPLYGIWTVEDFAADGPEPTPSTLGGLHWMRVIFDNPVYGMRMDFAIQAVDGSARFFLLHYDGDPQDHGAIEARDPFEVLRRHRRRPLGQLPATGVAVSGGRAVYVRSSRT